jgi:hypothetical protein
VARLSSPLLVLISLALMAQLGSIQQAWHVTLLLGAGLGVPLLLRWLWRRSNAWGELGAIVASGAAAPILLAAVESEALRLLAIALVGTLASGTLASVIASLATAPDSDEQLDGFYERVRPPGFWGVPEARSRLARNLLALLAAAGTLFTSLVGLGSWLVGSTAPAGLPSGVWIGLNLAVSAALVPVWWRALQRED